MSSGIIELTKEEYDNLPPVAITSIRQIAEWLGANAREFQGTYKVPSRGIVLFREGARFKFFIITHF